MTGLDQFIEGRKWQGDVAIQGNRGLHGNPPSACGREIAKKAFDDKLGYPPGDSSGKNLFKQLFGKGYEGPFTSLKKWLPGEQTFSGAFI